MNEKEKEVKELRDGLIKSYDYYLDPDEDSTEFAERVDKLIAKSRNLGKDFSDVIR